MQEPILIGNIGYREIRGITHRLTGYVKSCSILWLHTFGIPVLDGMIIDAWHSITPECINAFTKQIRSDLLLLRIDYKNQRWTDRRGGFLVETNEVADLWKDLSKDKFIPILLEPASPYSNQCALTALLLESD